MVLGCVALTFAAAQIQLRVVLDLPSDEIRPGKFVVPLALGTTFGVLLATIRALFARSRALREQLAQRERALAEANRGLESKVAERTRALEHAHQQVLHAQRLDAIGKVASSVAHDFNNMLTVVFACLDGLESSASKDAELAKNLGEVRGACERARQISKQLLMFSRKDARRTDTVQVGSLVDAVVPMARRLAGAGVSVEADVDRALTLRCDRSQLEQVLVNLAVNARDAGARHITIGARRLEGGADTLAVQGPDGALELSVTDDGAGMSPEVLRQAIEPFFTTKPPGRGTGLGLSVAYNVVHEQGGAFAIDSVEGKGTTIRMTLPAAPPPAATASPTEERKEPQATQGPKVILLVEDEAVVRRTVRRLLEGAGFAVVEAHSLESARAALDKHGARIDALVTDLRLPDGNGTSILKLLATRHPGMPALAMSGFVEESDRELLGAVELLPKPFSSKDLVARVRALVGAT
ncbi:MAG: response regulator [Deltaproteobacteria bacterium]|nr:response regulator [Deltaproteobacteria bacterium]